MDRRKRTAKIILTAICIAVVAALAFIFFQFKKQQTAPIPLPKSAVKTLMNLAGIHQTATKDGKIEWELDAESAHLEAQSGRMILNSPVIDFYMEDGTKVHLTAETGVLDTHSNDVQVSGNVLLKNDRYTLTAQELAYDHTDRTLQSDRPVFIKSNAFNLRADTMTYNLKDNLAQFDGRVEGILSENKAF